MPITILDGILVGVTLFSAVLAMVRGFSREVLSVASWIAAAAAAYTFYPLLVPLIMDYVSSENIATVVSAGIIFLVALIVVSVLTMRIADFVVDSRVGPIDRTLGFVFGVLRGILIAIVITIFGTWLLPNNLPPWAANSQTLPQLQTMGNTLISMLPEELEAQVTQILKGGTGLTDETSGGPIAPVEDGTDATEDGSVQPAPGA